MKVYIEKEKYEEIKRLVDCATSACSKKNIEPYIKQLEFISNWYNGKVSLFICGGCGICDVLRRALITDWNCVVAHGKRIVFVSVPTCQKN